MAEYHSIFTGEQIDERLTAVPGKYTKPADGIPATDMDEDVQAALALAATSIQSLADYYNKEQVDAMLASVGSAYGVTAASLPTAGADTLGKVYYIGPTNGEYERYITTYDGSDYDWLDLGSTAIDLTQYATKEELSQLNQEAGDCILVDGFGATPDGETDCTDAIMSAVEAARESGKRLVFGDGTYLTRKGIVMTSGMRVEGSGKTEIKNASAVLDDEAGNAGNGYCAVLRTTEAAAAGATSIKTSSAEGLAVGQEITIIDPSIPSYQETSADITSISEGGVTEYTPVFESGSYNITTGQPVANAKMLRSPVIDFSGTLYCIHYSVQSLPAGMSVNPNVQIFTWKADGTWMERVVPAFTLGVEKEIVLDANVGKIAFVLNCSLSDHDLTGTDIAAIQGSVTYSSESSGGGNAYTIGIDTSRFTADGQNGGLVAAIATNAYVTTDFAMIKTVDTKAATNIEIRRLALLPCGSNTEPYIYLISPINQTHQMVGVPQGKIIIEDVEISGSVHDGISTQGSGDVYINRCFIHDVRFKAIHFGTSCDKVNITGNVLKDCGNSDSASVGGANGGGGAVYFCVNNHRVIIKGNHIDNCKRGVFGFDWRGGGETDTDSVVAENTFTGCSLYGVYLLGGMRMVVANNVFRAFQSSAIPIKVTSDSSIKSRGCVISGNVIGGFNANAAAVAAISVDGAVDLVVAGNNICALAPNSNSDTVPSSLGHVCDIVVAGSSRVLVDGNVTDGSIDISDSGNTGVVKGNNIEAS